MSEGIDVFASTARPRFRGRAVEIGGVTYVVPPMALGAVQENLPKLNALMKPDSTGLLSPEQMGFALDVAHAAFQRNYPAMTRAELAELLDLGNLAGIIAAVAGVSGLVKQELAPGEAATSP
jgi:hypothetical protein